MSASSTIRKRILKHVNGAAIAFDALDRKLYDPQEDTETLWGISITENLGTASSTIRKRILKLNCQNG